MTSAIQVLEFVTSFHVGGTERQFVNLVRGLRGTPYRVHLACFRAQGELLEELRADGLPIMEMAMPSLCSSAAAAQLAGLVRYLRRQRIDIVHTTGLYPNIFGICAAWLARTPVRIASVRDMGQMWSPRQKWLQRIACRRAHAVVTNAEAIAVRLRGEGYDAARLAVIKNGTISRADPRPAPSRPAVRRELGIPADAPVVVMVCRLDRLKGIEDFVTAAVAVIERRPQARFLIVGGASNGLHGYAEELRLQVARLGLQGRVIFAGNRCDVHEVLPEMTVSVSSSLTEGLSNTLIESMAAGLPVVATAVGGNAEVVEDGVTGLLVPSRDPAALARAISLLLDDPARAAAMGMAGRRRVETTFTRERMTDDTTGLYGRLLDRSRRRLPRRSARVWGVSS